MTTISAIVAVPRLAAIKKALETVGVEFTDGKRPEAIRLLVMLPLAKSGKGER
jgi:hypothetical protein